MLFSWRASICFSSKFGANLYHHCPFIQISRLFLLQGLCISTPERFAKLEGFIRLWRNECLRVFHDRLIDEKDKEMVQGFIKNLVEENFQKHEEFIQRNPCLFGDYRTALQVIFDVRLSGWLSWDILSPQQYGFRTKHSTEFAIAAIYDDMICTKDIKLITCTLILYVGKAFDCVDHNITWKIVLLWSERNTPKTSWFLLRRQGSVYQSSRSKSSFLIVTYGVSQGSVLVPYYSLYINDIVKASNFNIVLYADDINLHISGKNYEILEEKVNNELKTLIRGFMTHMIFPQHFAIQTCWNTIISLQKLDSLMFCIFINMYLISVLWCCCFFPCCVCVTSWFESEKRMNKPFTVCQESEPRLYEDVQDFEAAKALFQEILEEYNENHTAMNLVLFDDALGKF